MNELAWWKRLIVILLLGALGTLLYFSGSAFFNVWAVPLMQELSPEQAHQSIAWVLVGISFLAALISAFFSVFLYEMTGGGRPLLMAILFALPVVLIQLYALTGSRLSTEMVAIYLFETLMIWVAYLLLSYAGRRTWRRFFATRRAAGS